MAEQVERDDEPEGEAAQPVDLAQEPRPTSRCVARPAQELGERVDVAGVSRPVVDRDGSNVPSRRGRGGSPHSCSEEVSPSPAWAAWAAKLGTVRTSSLNVPVPMMRPSSSTAIRS